MKIKQLFLFKSKKKEEDIEKGNSHRNMFPMCLGWHRNKALTQMLSSSLSKLYVCIVLCQCVL